MAPASLLLLPLPPFSNLFQLACSSGFWHISQVASATASAPAPAPATTASSVAFVFVSDLPRLIFYAALNGVVVAVRVAVAVHVAS